MAHVHKPQFQVHFSSGTVDKDISFHPKLAIWLKEIWKMPEGEGWSLEEWGCEDGSCPLLETKITTSSGKFLKIGRKKEEISKQDFVLAVQKQGMFFEKP